MPMNIRQWTEVKSSRRSCKFTRGLLHISNWYKSL